MEPQSILTFQHLLMVYALRWRSIRQRYRYAGREMRYFGDFGSHTRPSGADTKHALPYKQSRLVVVDCCTHRRVRGTLPETATWVVLFNYQIGRTQQTRQAPSALTLASNLRRGTSYPHFKQERPAFEDCTSRPEFEERRLAKRMSPALETAMSPCSYLIATRDTSHAATDHWASRPS